MTTIAQPEFERIAAIAKQRWGLDLTDRKMQLVSNRLTKLMRHSGFTDVCDYLEHLERDATEEDELMFFDALSTNVTSFFRERGAFECLEREFYTPLKCSGSATPGRRIRIWSAGCSTGPEAYSLAIHALEQLPDLADWDIRILATDLAGSALEKARKAIFPIEMIDSLPVGVVRKYFRRGRGANAGLVQVAPAVRELVSIAQLNLMNPWPMKGPFDVIFCRNVMIYFDRPTRESLVNRMYELLRPGGLLAVGSAETLSGTQHKFRTVRASVYRKEPAGDHM